jgi:hypothetical protein
MDARRTIGQTAGTLDYCAAVLSRAQSGADRSLIEGVRAQLKDASATLLVLRAHLAPIETHEPSEAGR